MQKSLNKFRRIVDLQVAAVAKAGEKMEQLKGFARFFLHDAQNRRYVVNNLRFIGDRSVLWGTYGGAKNKTTDGRGRLSFFAKVRTTSMEISRISIPFLLPQADTSLKMASTSIP